MILKSKLNKKFYKPKEIAILLGLNSRTIQNYCRKGIIKDQKLPSGKRIIQHEDFIAFLESKNLIYDDINERMDIIYCRVSTNKQKNNGDLNRQKEKIINNIIYKNPNNLKIFTEVGSGLNDNRKQLNKIIDLVSENKVNRIFILYKDRLTIFGFNYLEKFFNKYNTKIEVISDEIKEKSIEEELAEDIISIIHSFSGKLYGLRKKINLEINKIEGGET